MNALAARRRHPAAIAVLLLIGLFLMGAAYSAVAPRPAEAGVVSQDDVSEGKQLFQANCASCHGLNAEGRKTGSGDAIAGPTLAGVGAAAVDFQMSTGRMPMRAPTAQAPRSDTIKFSEEDIAKISAYVASLAPGPAIPSEEMVDPTKGDPAKGGELFRVNCAMCHNSSGAGGALTRGKYAPSLMDVAPKDIYMAMETGPQSMPVFNDANLSPEAKNSVIAYLKVTQNEPNIGGMNLGNMGPVSEGMFIWIFGLALMIGVAFWLGQKAA